MELATQSLNRHHDAWAWRLVATGASFVFFGLGGLVLRLVILPLAACLPGDAATRRRRARRIIGGAMRLHGWFMWRTRILDFSIDGVERLGQPGQLIVANHPCLIDVVFLLGQVPQANCIVKAALFANPFTRGPLRAARYIANDGSTATLDRAADTLRDGQCLLIFPEGTRTTPGTAPVFQRGAAAIALRGARTLTPVFIRVDPPTLTKGLPWYRIPPCRFRVQLRVGEDADLAAYAELPPPIAARRLTDHLQQRFHRETFTP